MINKDRILGEVERAYKNAIEAISEELSFVVSKEVLDELLEVSTEAIRYVAKVKYVRGEIEALTMVREAFDKVANLQRRREHNLRTGKPRNAGTPWTDSQREDFNELWSSLSLRGLMAHFGRGRGAIMSELRRQIITGNILIRTGEDLEALRRLYHGEKEYMLRDGKHMKHMIE